MKKLFLFFFMSCFSCLGYAAPSDNYQLMIKTVDGDITYVLSEMPEISFTATDVVIIVNEVETSISKNILIEFVFEKRDVSALLQYPSSHTTLTYRWLSNGDVELTNTGSIDIVNVYAVTGQLLTSQMGIGSSVISLSKMPSGVYVVSVNYGQTLKITKL